MGTNEIRQVSFLIIRQVGLLLMDIDILKMYVWELMKLDRLVVYHTLGGVGNRHTKDARMGTNDIRQVIF